MEKHFCSREDWELERNLYHALPLDRPELLEERPGVLVTAWCPFPTLLEVLETQERTGFDPAPWRALCRWIAACSAVLGIVPGDGNLLNFLWDGKRERVLGLDFERYRLGAPGEAGPLMAAMMLEYSPACTAVKCRAAGTLISEFRLRQEDVQRAECELRRRREKTRREPLSGIILAGGRSKRMGTCKAELHLGGETLLDRQIAKMRRAGIRDIMISGPVRRTGEGIRSIPDELPDRGPLGGIQSCLKAAENSRCLVLSTDTPLIPESLLLRMVSEHRGGVTVLESRGRLEPLTGIYDRSVAAEAAELTAQRGAPVRSLLEKVPWRAYSYAGPEELLVNCNTPDDLRLAEQTLTSYREQGIHL